MTVTATRTLLVADPFLPARTPAAPDATSEQLAADRAVRAVVAGLVDRGGAVTVVAPGPGLPSYRGAAVVRLGGRAPETTGRQVRDALLRSTPDLVQVHAGAHGGGKAARKAFKHAERLGVPTLLVQHAPVEERERERWLDKVVARADRVVATDPWVAEQVGEQLAAAGGRTAASWLPGTDPAAWSPVLRDAWLHRTWSRAGSAGGPHVVVGHSGPLRRSAGVRLLEALDDLTGTRLVVVGDGAQRRRLEDRLPTARFTGALDGGHLATAYASMDLLVATDDGPGTAALLLDAMASGLPVVAPDSGAVRRVVEHGVTGLLVAPGSPGALRAGVAALAGHEHRARTGAAAREAVVRRTWHDAVTELVEEHHAPLLAGAGVLTGRGAGAPSAA